MQPETRYTRVGEAWIGYQVLGDGPIDLVFLTGLASNIETQWDYPPFARMLERMASYSRLIVFDRRGSGISDPVSLEDVPTWEHWADDLHAVLDAVGSERAAILAQFDGALWGILFAASHPDRTQALVLWNGFSGTAWRPDYPSGQKPDQHEATAQAAAALWGTPDYATLIEPDLADDEAYVRWSGRYLRTSLTPGRVAAFMRYTGALDVRDVLPAVRVPTLVLHRALNNFIPIEWGRYIADHIDGAKFVEVPGGSLNMWSDQSRAIHAEIEGFLGVVASPFDRDRVLATVLFTDIVESTQQAAALGDRLWRERLAEHDRIAREQIDRFDGRLVNTMGDGLLASFEGPGRAIRCAHSLGRALESAGVRIRAGLHTGEIELREGDDIGGIAVHIAARVMGEAGPGEVVCSPTVKDLVAGSEFSFEDRGLCTLKGVPDEWQLYSVRQA